MPWAGEGGVRPQSEGRMPEAQAALLGSEQLCGEYGSLHSTRNVTPELWPPAVDCLGRKKERKKWEKEIDDSLSWAVVQAPGLLGSLCWSQRRLSFVWSSPTLPRPPANLLSHTALGRVLRRTWQEPHLGYRRGRGDHGGVWEHQYMITTHP